METQFSCRPPSHLFHLISDYGGENLSEKSRVEGEQLPGLQYSESANTMAHIDCMCDRSTAELRAASIHKKRHDLLGSTQSSTDNSEEENGEISIRAGQGGRKWFGESVNEEASDVDNTEGITEEISLLCRRLEHSQLQDIHSDIDKFEGLAISIAPIVTSGQHAEVTEIPSTPDENRCDNTNSRHDKHSDKFESMRSEIERIKMEVDKHADLIRSKSIDTDSNECIDPSENNSIWNTNALCILMWTSSFWPSGRSWNHDEEKFENSPTFSNHKLRSRSQRWIENRICPILFMFFAPAFIFVEMCILSGIIDQGVNLKVSAPASALNRNTRHATWS